MLRIQLFVFILLSILTISLCDPIDGVTLGKIYKAFDWGSQNSSRSVSGYNLGDYEVDVLRSKSPIYFDWRDKGKVSPPKDQGSCNACWAYSIIGAIESQVAIIYDKQLLLSEQFLIDCVNPEAGCGPGNLAKSYGLIVENYRRAVTAKSYPKRHGVDKCYFDENMKFAPVTGYKTIEPFNEEAIARAIVEYGPVSAGINSNSMAKYKGSYIDEPSDEDCDPTKLNHSVVIVGYNTHVDENTGEETPYWIIKNSWGEDWGDEGFYYLVRGRNACGIARDVTVPFVH